MATHVDSGTIDLVARADAERQDGEVQRRRAVRHGGCVTRYRGGGELPLEHADGLAGVGVPVVGRRLGDVADLEVGDPRPGDGDALVGRVGPSPSSAGALSSSSANVLPQVGVELAVVQQPLDRAKTEVVGSGEARQS